MRGPLGGWRSRFEQMITFVACFFLPIIGHAFFFDLIVRTEYVLHRHEWEVDGRPRGWFWRAPEHGRVFGGIGARTQVSWEWFWRTPAWAVTGVTSARVRFFWFRACLVSWPAFLAIAALLLGKPGIP